MTSFIVEQRITEPISFDGLDRAAAAAAAAVQHAGRLYAFIVVVD